MTFNFFFKRNKKIVDCFTANQHAYNLFPITPSSKNFPDWWKNTPATLERNNSANLTIEVSTAKTCQGILDLYKKSYTLPLWSDLLMETEEQGCRFQFADGISTLSFHESILTNHAFGNYLNIKLLSPWFLKESSGVNFLFNQPFWNMPNDIDHVHIPPGILEFKYQHSTHVNLLLSKGHRHNWAAGRAMATLTPLTEASIEFRNHLVSDSELKNISGANLPFFVGAYHKSKKITESKCPYSKQP